jgi:hydroxypyruvate isomerase
MMQTFSSYRKTLGVLGDIMLKFAANISWLYREWPLLERPIKAAEDGFDGVECLFPYQFTVTQLAKSLKKSALPLVLINAPAGDWDAGERGLAGLPSKETAFKQSLETAMQYATALGCKQVHVMAGVYDPAYTKEAQDGCLITRLAQACEQAEVHGITVLIEALNKHDVPNYIIPDLKTALRIQNEVNRENLKIQFDIYHQQRTDGDLAQNLNGIENQLGHIQCAGVPGRHEPNIGEVDYNFVFKQLIRQGYNGWIGAEYSPRQRTRDGLDWLTSVKNL